VLLQPPGVLIYPPPEARRREPHSMREIACGKGGLVVVAPHRLHACQRRTHQSRQADQPRQRMRSAHPRRQSAPPGHQRGPRPSGAAAPAGPASRRRLQSPAPPPPGPPPARPRSPAACAAGAPGFAGRGRQANALPCRRHTSPAPHVLDSKRASSQQPSSRSCWALLRRSTRATPHLY